jgi:hypothetical protein
MIFLLVTQVPAEKNGNLSCNFPGFLAFVVVLLPIAAYPYNNPSKCS